MKVHKEGLFAILIGFKGPEIFGKREQGGWNAAPGEIHEQLYAGPVAKQFLWVSS